MTLEWSFPNDEHKLKDPVDLKTSIQLTSSNNFNDHMSKVQSGPSEGQRNLGAWIAPDGNNNADLTVLCTKGHSMSINIATSQLQCHEVSIA